MSLSVICKVQKELPFNRKNGDKEALLLEMSDGSHFEIEHVIQSGDPAQPELYNGAWLQPSKYRDAPDEVCEALSTADKTEFENWLTDLFARIPCHLVSML